MNSDGAGRGRKFYKAVPDGSVSNIRSLIHLVILQSLGDTTFFKKAVQLNSFSSFTVVR